MGGRYRLDSVIAEGGMGVVYRAWHLLLARPVAIKRVREEYVRNQEMVKRFLEEARAGARIRSEHATQVLDFGLDDSGLPYLVMELLEGRDLRELLDTRGRFPVPIAADLMLQACAALAEAHSLGIVHRDLKPENLFLARREDLESEIVKVLDFGVSKQLGRASFTWTDEDIGSPNYMAPEQVKSPTQSDARADVWSLGAILFELVTDVPAFDGDTLPDIASAVLTGEAPRLRSFTTDAPALLERVVLKCLRKDRNERFQSVDELATALNLVRQLSEPQPRVEAVTAQLGIHST